jgi:PIN like domain
MVSTHQQETHRCRLSRSPRSSLVEVELYRERYKSGKVPDERWIAEVTSEGLVILTKDTHIRTRRSERTVFEAAGARAFVLATRGATRLVNPPSCADCLASHRVRGCNARGTVHVRD